MLHHLFFFLNKLGLKKNATVTGVAHRSHHEGS